MRPGVRLGIDVGDARIGVAASDLGAMVVVPVETVPTHPNRQSLRRIVSIANEREAIEVVVGLPRNMRGDEGPAADKARKFAQKLAKALPNTRICLIDERLSTVDAQSRLRGAGVDTRGQRNVVDQVAAQIILERAIDIERSSSAPPGEMVSQVDQNGSGSK